MDESKHAWDTVGSELGALGARVKDLFRTTGDDAAGAQQRQALKDALASVTGAVGQAFDALGDAARDSGVRDHATRAASAFGQAITVTLNEVGEQVGERFDRARRRDATAGEPWPDPAAEASGATEARAPRSTPSPEDLAGTVGEPGGAPTDELDDR